MSSIRPLHSPRRLFCASLLLPLLLIGSLFAVDARGAAPVEFELITERGFPLGGAQRWVELLAGLEQSSIRIRQARSGEREAISNSGTEGKPIYRVVGVLTSSNRLRLPGGEFGLGDRARLGEWIKRIQNEGIDSTTKKTTVFGLTDEQLVAFHEKLAVPVACVTQERRAGDVARDIVKGIQLEFSVSPAARQAFATDELVLKEDLQGMASGTALAAAIRPLGLVIRPEKTTNGTVRLLICEVGETEEAWPIGWPPEDIPGKVAPKLFEYLKVTIAGRPLTEAMNAIQQRVNIPFLLDHNSLARKRIDPAAVKVNYAQERAMYQRILDNLLFQAGLLSELRVDEAGQPFLWISTR